MMNLHYLLELYWCHYCFLPPKKVQVVDCYTGLVTKSIKSTYMVWACFVGVVHVSVYTGTV
jgi:hypothetical protein